MAHVCVSRTDGAVAVDERCVDGCPLEWIQRTVAPVRLEDLAGWRHHNQTFGLATVPPGFCRRVVEVDEKPLARAVPVRLPHRKTAIDTGLANVSFEVQPLIAVYVVTSPRAK